MRRGVLLLPAIALLATGCRQDMHDQPRQKPLSRSEFFADAMAWSTSFLRCFSSSRLGPMAPFWRRLRICSSGIPSSRSARISARSRICCGR